MPAPRTIARTAGQWDSGNAWPTSCATPPAATSAGRPIERSSLHGGCARIPSPSCRRRRVAGARSAGIRSSSARSCPRAGHGGGRCPPPRSCVEAPSLARMCETCTRAVFSLMNGSAPSWRFVRPRPAVQALRARDRQAEPVRRRRAGRARWCTHGDPGTPPGRLDELARHRRRRGGQRRSWGGRA